MFCVIHGSDQLKVSEEKTAFINKYRSDDFNFQEFDGTIDIAQLSGAIKQAPMFTEFYVVLVHVDHKQFVRIAQFLQPASFTALLLICEGFNPTEGDLKDLKIDSIIDCRPRSFRENVKWIKTQTEKLGYSMDLEDRKKLALLFKSSKEISDVLFQMSFLNDFDRRVFFNDLFKTKQEFVWDLFISLSEGNQKAFFKKYSEQLLLNTELTSSQFNMKIIGGLLFCLGHYQDAPEWISVKLKTMQENGEVLIPFLHSHLVETLVLSRKEQSNIPILMRFVSILSQVKKL